MRIDLSKKVRKVAGENIVIMQGSSEADMTTVIGLNKSAMLLYEKLKGKDFSLNDAVKILLDEYEVDESTAKNDATDWVMAMQKNRLLL